MIITLTTDFGYGEYVGAMRGVILNINPEAKIIDVSHNIRRGNIREGAFVLYSAVPHFPPAIHIAVVDPTVGTARRALMIECDKAILIGPDNGILIPAAKKLGMKIVREITSKELCLPNISGTFHGRDVFASVAAHLSRDMNLEKVGEMIHDWVDLDFGGYTESPNTFEGRIIYVDNFGNLITSVPGDVIQRLASWGHKADVRIENKLVRVEFVRSYGHVESGEPLLTVSSSSFIEIAIRDGHASEKFGAEEGSPVSIRLLRPRKQT